MDKWNSIGKIILKGYHDTSYFPTFVSKAFLLFCIFGHVSDDVLMTSSFNYLSKDEANLIQSVLADEVDVNILASDEFLELPEQFSWRTLVNKGNVKQVIIEFARQEMVKNHI